MIYVLDKKNRLFLRKGLLKLQMFRIFLFYYTRQSFFKKKKRVSNSFALKNNLFKQPEYKKYIKNIISQNVKLIECVPKEFYKEVKSIVWRSLTTSEGSVNVNQYFSLICDAKKDEISDISLDQICKAYRYLDAYRMKKLGAKNFEWIFGYCDYLSHKEMNGKIFSFENLPIINRDIEYEPKKKGLPGQAFRCSCVMGFIYDPKQ